MTITGIGIDIVHVQRIVALVRRRGELRFARRVLSESEMQDWKPGTNGSLRYLSVRFAVKEAAYKAMYPAVQPTWKELTYESFGRLHTGSKPQLQYNPLRPYSSQSDSIGKLHVSVSHDGEYIAATVIAEKL